MEFTNSAKTINNSWCSFSDSISTSTSGSTIINNIDSLASNSTTSLIHFDSTGITISNDIELNLNYEKVYDRLEEVKEKRNRKEFKKMFENVIKNFEFGKCG